MNLSNNVEIKMPVTKLVSAWGVVLFTDMWVIFESLPWDTLGKFAAFVYSACLIYEYISKKIKAKGSNGSEQNLS